MASKPRVAIVGAGNLGSALALALHRAGYRVSEVAFRDGMAHQRARRLATRVRAKVVPLSQACFDAEVTWVCVPDSVISACARLIAGRGDWRGKIVLHPSGALSSRELQALRRRGAAVASAHPLMTFVRKCSAEMRGVPFAMEGDPAALRAARRLVRDLGGAAFPIRPEDKPLYHAWGAFASPLMIALLATAEKVARAAGLTSTTAARKRMLPILQQTLRNYGSHGAADAFSGPLIRGDVATVRQHLRALAKIPAAKRVYVALARAALNTLPARNRTELERELNRDARQARGRR